jgi:hypothetical protein
MKRGFCQAISWFILGMPAFGQVSETSLRTLYGKPVNGSYIVRPGITIAVTDGPKGEACVLTISGPITEPELTTIIDQAVPAASRGLGLRSMIDCVGACQSIREYEKLTVSFAVMAGQIARPAAIITFKSKSCEHRAREARAGGFSITRLPTSPK